jgi:DNA polymerase-1
VGKWQYRNEGKRISKSVIASKSIEDLVEAKKFLNGLLNLRKSEKLVKTYIKGTKKAIKYNQEDKIFVDFKFDGTTTGRLSCASYNAQEAMGVSFHTLPRDTTNNIRSLFTAPKDWSFITADYAAMELRILSHVAKEGNMQKAFIEGEDLHTYSAKLLFNKSSITKEERQIAKTVSFLIVYGGGAYNLSETMGISLSRSDEIINNYMQVYPGISEYMEFINNFIKENGYAYTIFGRKRNLSNVDSKDIKVINRALRQGLNFSIQSSASDVLLCALLGVAMQFRAKGMQARTVATVHDSMEIVCPKDEVEQALTIIYNEMVNYPLIKRVFNVHFDVPLKIDVEVGKSFGEGEEIVFKDGIPLTGF